MYNLVNTCPELSMEEQDVKQHLYSRDVPLALDIFFLYFEHFALLLPLVYRLLFCYCTWVFNSLLYCSINTLINIILLQIYVGMSRTIQRELMG